MNGKQNNILFRKDKGPVPVLKFITNFIRSTSTSFKKKMLKMEKRSKTREVRTRAPLRQKLDSFITKLIKSEMRLVVVIENM
jgi:hypothetical protein